MNLLAALRSLTEHWQRAALSGLGIMVASVAVILLMSIGIGVQHDVTSQIEDFGANTLIILPGQISIGGFNPNIQGQSYLSDQNVKDILTVPGVKRVAKWCFAGGGIRYGKKTANPLLVATSPDWFHIYKLELDEGQVFTEGESHGQVCVLGGLARQQLFGKEDPVGKTVHINQLDYRVIGTVHDKAGDDSMFSMQSFSNVAYIPLATLQDHNSEVQYNRLFVQLDENVEPKGLVKAVGDALGKTLDQSQYAVLTQQDLLSLVFSFVSILQTLVVGLTSIALFVGGIGVMATMTMSANERSKEIGVRKSVGATNRDIFLQFLAESAVIGVAGVSAGMAVSLVVITYLSHATKVKPILTPGIVAAALLVGVGVGTVFGLIPAMRAARKDPIAALRNEG